MFMRAANSNSDDPLKNKVPQEVALELNSAKNKSLPLTALTDCLVDADTAVSAQFGRGRRNALGASALVQFCAICALLIWPLFATGSRLIAKSANVSPPYGGMPHANRARTTPQFPRPQPRGEYFPTPPQIQVPTSFHRRNSTDADDLQSFGLRQSDTNGTNDNTAGASGPGFLNILGAKSNTPPPPTPATTALTPRSPVKVSEGVVLASLIHRVEPIYPFIAKETRTEGVVELRAIIARNGSIQQLQIVSGNPVLALAAMEAVRQWRFRPTLLNGEPIEVDTFFTVKFHLGQ